MACRRNGKCSLVVGSRGLPYFVRSHTLPVVEAATAATGVMDV